jgi:hypothetical protein
MHTQQKNLDPDVQKINAGLKQWLLIFSTPVLRIRDPVPF